MSTDTEVTSAPAERRWRPLESQQRRVLGVLIEKAKTTPEAYPLSLNALRTGCNQKNNRAPLMQLEESQVDDALDELRKVGAVSVVQGGGRIDRYRHLGYEWLGVDKVELAVMAELLLRGSQTVGELRGRAARMEPIKGLSELQPTLDSLHAKGLVQYLTPPGRGSIITHTLYLDREIEKLQREAGQLSASSASPAVATVSHGSASHAAAVATSLPPSRPAPASSGTEPNEIAALREEVSSLRAELLAVRREFESAKAEQTTATDEIRRDLDQLNRQLGN